VLITGAAGAIGSQLVEELSASHDLCLLDLRRVKGRKSIIADLSQPRAKGCWWNLLRPHWSDAFQGAQVVVHLAADVDPSASWESVCPNNIQTAWNVIEAASEYRVPRVVFASSNWAIKSLEQKLAPDCYLPDGPKIASDTPPCPVNAYGLAKAFGENTGRMFIDQQKLQSFVAVRIGHYNAAPAGDDTLSTLWIGADDLRILLRRCVEAEYTGFHVVYGVSAQLTAPYDLSHTCRLLSWNPRQLP